MLHVIVGNLISCRVDSRLCRQHACFRLFYLAPLHNAGLPTGLPVFASKLWELFELCELEGNQRAARDPAWAALLARVRVGKFTKEDEKVLARLVLTKGSKRKPAPGAVHL